jgi:hypothetical protein
MRDVYAETTWTTPKDKYEGTIAKQEKEKKQKERKITTNKSLNATELLSSSSVSGHSLRIVLNHITGSCCVSFHVINETTLRAKNIEVRNHVNQRALA